MSERSIKVFDKYFAIFFEDKVTQLMRVRIYEMLCKRKENYGRAEMSSH